MKRISQKEFFLSTALVLLSTVCLSMSAAFWKALSVDASLPFVTFFRFFSPFFLLILWILLRRKKIHVPSIWPHLFRAFSVTIGQFLLLYVLSQTNLLLATLLNATSGLFAPLLMSLFLKVHASRRAIISIIISFAGVAIALGSWNQLWAPISLLGLLSGLFTAIGQLLQHQRAKSEDIATMSALLFGLCSLFSLPLFLFFPGPVLSINFNLSMLGMIVTFGLFTVGNQTLKTAAYKKVNKPSTLSPFLYATIIFSGIIDWIWRGIVPPFHTQLGVLIILFGAFIMSLRKVPKNLTNK
ncbi:MAG: EamA family transporter [Chlamydiales bacterium]|nr:EamA family transporter [Chlamydiales bacterium]